MMRTMTTNNGDGETAATSGSEPVNQEDERNNEDIDGG